MRTQLQYNQCTVRTSPFQTITLCWKKKSALLPSFWNIFMNLLIWSGHWRKNPFLRFLLIRNNSYIFIKWSSPPPRHFCFCGVCESNSCYCIFWKATCQFCLHSCILQKFCQFKSSLSHRNTYTDTHTEICARKIKVESCVYFSHKHPPHMEGS